MAMSMISEAAEDESFVVLGSSPPESAVQTSLCASIGDVRSEPDSCSLHVPDSFGYVAASPHDPAALAEENALLRATLADNNRTQREQLLRLAAAQEEVASAQREHTQRLRNTRALVLQLRSENQQLKERAANLERVDKDTNERLKIAETRWKQAAVERQELEKALRAAASDSLHQYERENLQLKEQLLRLRHESQDANERLRLAETKCEQAIAERDELAKRASARGTHQSAETLAAALVSRDEELSRLRKGAEERELLRAQLQVYSDDFATEREARTKLAGEKADLLAELRGLQGRNQQLTQQLEEIRRINPSILEHAGASSKELSAEPTLLRCPVCGEGSRNLALLEHHLLRCLPE